MTRNDARAHAAGTPAGNPEVLFRRFRVRLAGSPHQERTVLEPSFEAAAVAYVEHLPHPDGPFRVLVHDTASGHEHSFHFDFGSHEPR